MSKIAPALFFIVFGGFWTVAVVIGDIGIGANLFAAWRSQSYATTAGTITQSEVKRDTDPAGTSEDPDIRYAYQVDGQEFEGTRYDYSGVAASSDADAAALVRAYPKNAVVNVFYDPGHPARAVLVPGVDASDLLLVMFLTPFNVIMAGLWWLGGTAAWQWWHGERPPAPSFRLSGATHVRLAPVPWLMGGAVGAGVAAFACSLAIAVPTGFHPPMWVVLGAWALVIAAGAVTAFVKRKTDLAGDQDLIIGDREVALPLGFGRTRREAIERAAIAGVTVAKIVDGNSVAFEVRLERRDGTNATIAEWSDGERAQKLAAWLGERIGVTGATR